MLFSSQQHQIQCITDHFVYMFSVDGGELFDKVVSIGQYDEPTGKLISYQMVCAVKVSQAVFVSCLVCKKNLQTSNLRVFQFQRGITLVGIIQFISKFNFICTSAC